MDDLINLASVVWNRFSTNLQATFDSTTPKKWIQLIIIAGAYMLLRPYIIKLGSKSQMKTHERESAEAAAISPNELRGRVQIPEDSDSEDDAPTAQATGPDWGKKARRRQRDMIKKLLEAEERRLQETKEEEEDKDIEEYLVKE
ncbi:protein trafficking Pga2 [Cercophora newfieldiana]|uniref:Protein trafficking Pga2 n=1 Tax=Cercophora newfieldiana TaxID=92897 RepID=A0AA39YGD1_9PEZI|nr:protein trafficking Pga2 [Cercophora newfieldiana]